MSLPSIKSLASTFRTRLEEVKTMSSITTTVARQYRLQEWASQIRECQRRPQNQDLLPPPSLRPDAALLLSFAPGSGSVSRGNDF